METIAANRGYKVIQTIFFTQIGLLLLLAVTFLIGHMDNGLTTGSFFYVIILGSIGASVSLMRRVKEKINTNDATVNTMLQNKVFSVFMPILYGTLMAGVVYLLFMSQILSGDGGGGLLTTNLFPRFTDPEITTSLTEQFVQMVPDGMKNTGKLLLWAFIAGYSERFVTGILVQLEKTGQRDKN